MHKRKYFCGTCISKFNPNCYSFNGPSFSSSHHKSHFPLPPHNYQLKTETLVKFPPIYCAPVSLQTSQKSLSQHPLARPQFDALCVFCEPNTRNWPQSLENRRTDVFGCGVKFIAQCAEQVTRKQIRHRKTKEKFGKKMCFFCCKWSFCLEFTFV